MVGCYGNDPEDRYFASKLDEHLEKQEHDFNQCKECGDNFKIGTSTARADESYCSQDCEHEHIMEIMEKHDFEDGEHLNSYMVEHGKLRKNCDESLNDIDEIRVHLDHIVDQIKRR